MFVYDLCKDEEIGKAEEGGYCSGSLCPGEKTGMCPGLAGWSGSAWGEGIYNARKDAGQILPYLTKEEILDQASAGKVSFHVHQGEDAQEEQAVENAIQCFEDGIYRVFADEEELTELTQGIPWKDGEEPIFTFIRLAMLAGCYW